MQNISWGLEDFCREPIEILGKLVILYRPNTSWRLEDWR